MGVDKRLLSDLARVAGGAAGLAAGMREEIEALVRQRVQRALATMDLVSREEFEAVKAVAQTARAEQEKLEVRLAALEGATSAKRKAASKKTPATDA